MASNLKRSKRTIGRRISSLESRTRRLQKRPTRTTIGPRVVLGSNLVQRAITSSELGTDVTTSISTAQATADGKNKIYRQTSQPTGGTYVEGDLWFDTDDGNKFYRYVSGAWSGFSLGDGAIASLSATKILAGSLDAGVIVTSNLDAGQITAGILSSIEIRGGAPVGGVYPFRVTSAGALTSYSGEIGAFTITNEALTASEFGSMPFDISSQMQIGSAGEIFGRVDVGSFYGTPYFTEVRFNRNNGEGISVTGTGSGSTLTTRILSSFIETNTLLIPGGNVQTQLNGKAATSHTAHTRIRADDGSVGTPAYSFTSDTDTGMYSNADGIIGFTTNGVLRARIGTSFLDLQSAIGITNATSISSDNSISAGTTIGSGGNITCGGDLIITATLNANGMVEMDQGPSTSTTAVAQTTAGTVGLFCFPTSGQPLANQTMRWKSGTGSSIRFKENINSLEQTTAALDRFWELDVIEFEYKDEYGGAIEKERPYSHRRRFGFIAEDAEEKVPYLASYDDDNLVDNVKFDSITTLLYAEVRKIRQFMIDNYGYLDNSL